MKNMSYSTYEITSVTYAGLNDNWDLQSLTQDPDNLGIFTAEVEIQKPSEWGFKLYLNWNWDLFYGGSDGNLYYLGNGITDDQVVQSGKYILTVDTVKKTYSLTSVE